MVRALRYPDLERAAKLRDPQFPAMVIAYLEQPDPPEHLDEHDDPETSPAPPRPSDAPTLARLKTALGRRALAGQTPAERRTRRAAAWSALVRAPHPPPRLRLDTLLLDLYDSDDPIARAMLREIFAHARLGWGLWRAFKTIYKRVEATHDLEMFGVMAWRLDAIETTPYHATEIGRGTWIYMRRRAWRFMRELGQAVPEVYPQFAVAVLRHYPATASFYGSWIASQVWGHRALVGQGHGCIPEPRPTLDDWAFPEAWKLRPGPLLQLLEDAPSETVCRFAILGLRQAFPEDLRKLPPTWVARLGATDRGVVHAFVVELLREDPRFHPAKLLELGLHDLALRLLTSAADTARTYAIEYARAHAPTLAVDRLVELARCRHRDAQAFAVERLEKRTTAEIGVDALFDLLASSRAAPLALVRLRKSVSRTDLTQDQFVRLSLGSRDQRKYVDALFPATAPPQAAYLIALLEHERLPASDRAQVLARLQTQPAAEIGVAWIQAALLRPELREAIAGWLRGGMLQGDELDLDWLKGLVRLPPLRGLALELLGDPKRVAPERIGVAWLLDRLREPDPELATFAREHLLHDFHPADFADARAGDAVLWDLATGRRQPESVRAFAAAYWVRAHAELGLTVPEPRAPDEPVLPPSAYAADRVLPAFDDPRPDVRALAARLGHAELRRWNDPRVPYRLARHRAREARVLGAKALLSLGRPDDPAALPRDWLLGDAVFALAESQFQSAREVALTLLGRFGDDLAPTARIDTLLDSPDRDIAIGVVRWLWGRHRSRPDANAVRPCEEGLPGFLERWLFALPPGRSEPREHPREDPPVSASTAKRRLVDVVATVGADDLDFARSVLPILERFRHSVARGERDACLCALARLRRAHPDLATSLPPSQLVVRLPTRVRFTTLTKGSSPS